MIRLGALLDELGSEALGSEGLESAVLTDNSGTTDRDLEITGVTHDSRVVQPGWLFCCVVGLSSDGHDFAAAAVQAGAVALVAEHGRLLAGVDVGTVPVLRIENVRGRLGDIAAAVFGHPGNNLESIGITGTSGKTSVVHLLASVLERSGRRFRTMGTLSGVRTTPEAPVLQAQLRAAVDNNEEVVAMEVSSHALELGRVNGMQFSVAAFTNLGHDHLDFHADMESYFSAKALLFASERSRIAVINVDDPYGARLANELADRGQTVRPVSMEDAKDLSISGAVSSFGWRDQAVTLQLSGRHNVLNALIAAEAAAAIGIDPLDVADGLCGASPPPGRMEWVNAGQKFPVIVDYAHKPEALESVLLAARDVVPSGKILVVVGCGGDRDPHKRPVMGRIAETMADVVVLTSDNPRSEDPKVIIEAMVAGMDRPEEATIIQDRAEAISWAVTHAGDNDLVLIAGKGHETTQVIGDQILDFDDRLTAFRAIGSAG